MLLSLIKVDSILRGDHYHCLINEKTPNLSYLVEREAVASIRNWM